MVRRLPVLSSAVDEDERPVWQWTAIGVVFVYAIWAPLVMAGSWVSARLLDRLIGDALPSDLPKLIADAPFSTRVSLWLAATAAPVATYAFACAASGALIGRFGARVTPRRAAAAGALAALLGTAMSLLRAPWEASLAALALLLPLGVLAAWVGGRTGVRLRNKSFLRPPPPPADHR
jgi:hypothetical protein